RLAERGVKVIVESSRARIFSDEAFVQSGAQVVDRADGADFLLGIKEPRIEDLMTGKTYAVFSHTIKGQPNNMPLLKAILDRDITLLDYECVTDRHGTRLVYFGRFAGICGMVDSLHHLGGKLRLGGIDNPFTAIGPAHSYESLDAIQACLDEVAATIERDGVPGQIAPCIIGITGHGHVSQGAQEMLDRLRPVEVHPRRISEFVEHERSQRQQLYKIVFLREEKFRSKEGGGYYFEEYLAHPERFESNLDRYLSDLTMLVHTSYWDERYPRLVTRDMVRRLAEHGSLRLEMIGDLACDPGGSIELTHRVTTIEKPTYTYDFRGDRYVEGPAGDGILIMAVDNLPAELPRDASVEFSAQVRRYVYEIATHGLEGDDDDLDVSPE
ncbi:MAG: hypothetical protein GY769_20495, partial [bacterium]|nr:hypothetical protein [bacterium]